MIMGIASRTPTARCLIVGALAAAAVWLPAATAQEAAASGKPVFVANGCYQCHGFEGQGGVAGPRIAPSPYPYEAFAALVRRPANEMPAYAGSLLSDADLRAIYGYVRSRPEPLPVAAIDLLR